MMYVLMSSFERGKVRCPGIKNVHIYDYQREMVAYASVVSER